MRWVRVIVWIVPIYTPDSILLLRSEYTRTLGSGQTFFSEKKEKEEKRKREKEEKKRRLERRKEEKTIAVEQKVILL